MSIAFTSIKGLTFYDMRRAFHGVTIFSPLEGTGAWIIDMNGNIVHSWEMGYKPALYGELLPNGNLLYAGRVENGPLTEFEGAGGIIMEVDWDGKKIWEYKNPYLHNAFFRMKNGNTLVIKWVKVPKEIADKVQGGEPGTERDGVMWGDAIDEVTPEGKVVWSWIAHEYLDPKIDKSCVLCPRSEWTHANWVQELADGNIIVCLMESDTIAIIDKKTGNITWRWGTGDLGVSHPHTPTVLENGNILIFDNCLHATLGISRIIEIDPKTKAGDMKAQEGIPERTRVPQNTVWGYPKSLMPGGGAGGSEAIYAEYFFSSIMSSCQRLANGNTLICEATSGRLFEINIDGELVWEYVNPLPFYEVAPGKTRPCMVTCAFRYGMDYPGLKRFVPVPEERRRTPGAKRAVAMMSAEEEERELRTLQTRLQGLGY